MNAPMNTPMNTMAFIGHWEIGIVVVLILVLVFGKRIPGLARNLGRSIVEFKAGLSGKKDDHDPSLPDERR